MDNNNDISQNTHVRLPLPLAITICLTLIGFGGTYTTLTSTSERLDALEKVVEYNEKLDREEREKIRKEEAERHKDMTEWFKKYMDDEVGGLRSDWERRYRDNINPRIQKLEK